MVGENGVVPAGLRLGGMSREEEEEDGGEAQEREGVSERGHGGGGRVSRSLCASAFKAKRLPCWR